MNVDENVARNNEYIQVLLKFDVQAFEDFLRRWDRPTWLLFKKETYKKKKVIICKMIMANQKTFEQYDKSLVERAKKYLMENDKKENK